MHRYEHWNDSEDERNLFGHGNLNVNSSYCVCICRMDIVSVCLDQIGLGRSATWICPPCPWPPSQVGSDFSKSGWDPVYDHHVHERERLRRNRNQRCSKLLRCPRGPNKLAKLRIKSGKLQVEKVWVQLTNPRDQLSHQIGYPFFFFLPNWAPVFLPNWYPSCAPPCQPPCRPPQCCLGTLWGVRDADRMEIRKYHLRTTDGRTNWPG